MTYMLFRDHESGVNEEGSGSMEGSLFTADLFSGSSSNWQPEPSESYTSHWSSQDSRENQVIQLIQISYVLLIDWWSKLIGEYHGWILHWSWNGIFFFDYGIDHDANW